MQRPFLLPRSRMSSVYKSWERPTTSTVVFEAAPKGRILHEGQKMPDVSTFSFSVGSHPESESCVLDSRHADALSRENLDSPPSSCSSLSGSPQTGYITSPHHPDMMLVPSEETYAQQELGKANGHITTSLSSLAGCNMDHSRPLRSENSASSGSMNHDQHLAVDFLPEDRPWESSPADSEVIDSECISSCSSLSEASVCTSSVGSEAILEDSEAQSSYKGPLDCMDSLEAALPLRKSLSRFFFGHSRSFSCLADVISVKDLAKPENPYARKRRSFASLNSGMERPRLFPTRNGAGIKKPPHNNKSTLALAVAMSTKEAMLEGNLLECQASAKLQKDSCTRSFSFSNFGSTGCQLSPDCSN